MSAVVTSQPIRFRVLYPATHTPAPVPAGDVRPPSKSQEQPTASTGVRICPPPAELIRCSPKLALFSVPQPIRVIDEPGLFVPPVPPGLESMVQPESADWSPRQPSHRQLLPFSTYQQEPPDVLA